MSPVKRLRYCVNGKWKESKTDKYMPVTNSSTGEVMAEAPCCTADEVNEAVEAAKAAFPCWSTTPVGKRVELMFRFRTILDAHLEELTLLVSMELGKTLDRSGFPKYSIQSSVRY